MGTMFEKGQTKRYSRVASFSGGANIGPPRKIPARRRFLRDKSLQGKPGAIIRTPEEHMAFQQALAKRPNPPPPPSKPYNAALDGPRRPVVNYSGGGGTKKSRTKSRQKSDEQLSLEKDNYKLFSEDVRNRFKDVPGSLKDAGERIMRELKPTIDEVVQSRPAMKKGGKVESKKMMRREVAFMKKNKAPKSMIAHEKAEMKPTRMAVGGRARPARARSPEERRNIRRQVAINRMRRASAPERAAPKNRRMPSPTELRNMTPERRQVAIRNLVRTAQRNQRSGTTQVTNPRPNRVPNPKARQMRNAPPELRQRLRQARQTKSRDMPRPRPGTRPPTQRPPNTRPGTRPIPNNREALLRGNLNSRPNRIPNPKARTMRNAPPELRQQLRRAQRTKNRNMPRPGTPRPNTPRPGTPRPRPNNWRDPRTGNGSIAGLREGARPKNRQMPRPGARPTPRPKNRQMPRPGARPTPRPKNRQMPRPGTRPTPQRPNPQSNAAMRATMRAANRRMQAGPLAYPGSTNRKTGGVIKTKKYAAGGMIPTASKKSPNSMGTSYSAGGRIKGKAVDGCAKKGKTRGRTM